jgi:hypothetical protein
VPVSRVDISKAASHKAKSLLEVERLFSDEEMALPRQSSKAVKSFNQKRKNKFDDDRNFHVIIAPGEMK